MAGVSSAEDGETVATTARKKHTSNPIHLFIVSPPSYLENKHLPL
jgi:hypothetical protein